MLLVGVRLRVARRARGWTQEKVAKQIGVDRSTYTKYETGVVEPSLEVLYRLSVLFDLDPQ